jgi:hypothetical protein
MLGFSRDTEDSPYPSSSTYKGRNPQNICPNHSSPHTNTLNSPILHFSLFSTDFHLYLPCHATSQHYKPLRSSNSAMRKTASRSSPINVNVTVTQSRFTEDLPSTRSESNNNDVGTRPSLAPRQEIPPPMSREVLIPPLLMVQSPSQDSVYSDDGADSSVSPCSCFLGVSCTNQFSRCPVRTALAD